MKINTTTEYVRLPDILRLGIYDSREGIMAAIAKGRLPRPVKVGGRLHWNRKELEEWIESKRVVIYRRRR